MILDLLIKLKLEKRNKTNGSEKSQTNYGNVLNLQKY